MTYTSLATPVPNTPILVSSFGALVKQNLDDLDGRVAAINATLGTWTGGTAISRLNNLESGRLAKFSITGATTLQSIAASSNTKLQFSTTTNPDTTIVTAGGTNQDTFTVVKTGWYSISVCIRCLTAGALPELSVYVPGTGGITLANVKGTNGAASRSGTVFCRFRLNAGDTFAVNCWNNGTTSTVDTGWGTASHITIGYEGL